MKEKKLVKVVLLLAMFIVLLNLPLSFSRSLKSGVRAAMAPLHELAAGGVTRVKNGFHALRGWGGLREENRKLQEENLALQIRLRELENLEGENTRLRRHLGFQQRGGQNLVPGWVISREVSGWWKQLRINRGRRDGLREDLAVITPEGLVGRVTQVDARTSDVLLVSDPTCRVHALIPSHDVNGSLAGIGMSWRGKVLCAMDLIDKDKKINPSDKVVTSGLGGVFPPGILIGTVQQVTMDDSRLYQHATVRPAVDLSRLEIVFVVADSREEETETENREGETDGLEPESGWDSPVPDDPTVDPAPVPETSVILSSRFQQPEARS